MIRYLNNKQIDKEKWDSCIHKCAYGFTYVYSWYLNIVSPGWAALVDEDYEIVMPLPIKTKLGIHYVIQPYFTQQMGMFSPKSFTKEKLIEFIETASKHYKYILLNFNILNLNFLDVYEAKQSQILWLDKEYEELRRGYSESNSKNIRRALRQNIVVQSTTTQGEMESILGKDKPHLWNKKALDEASRLMAECLKRGNGKIYGAYLDNQLVSACFLLIDHRRIYVLFSATSELGVSSKSKFLIQDQVIRDYADSGMALDFMGSIIPGVKFFNNGFGAADISYALVKINRLPFPLNLLKK